MFRNLLRPDSPLMITLTQLTDCIFLSLFWLLGCIPVVTAGASFAALYDSTFRAFRQGEKHSWQRFFHVYRQNWRAAIVPTVFFLLAGCGIGWGLIQLWNAAVMGKISWTLFSGGAFVGMLLTGILSVLFPVLSRFENTTAGLLRNTLLLALGNMPRTIALGTLNAMSVFICLRWIFPVFFLPSLAALLGSLLIEPMFKPFLNMEE